MTAEEIALFQYEHGLVNAVFHALTPTCPAAPGAPNRCDESTCDCFASVEMPAQITALRVRVLELEAQRDE